jgi:hypothetical protein
VNDTIAILIGIVCATIATICKVGVAILAETSHVVGTDVAPILASVLDIETAIAIPFVAIVAEVCSSIGT